METREFSIALMLSLTDGHMMTSFSEIQENIEWLVGYPVWTHQMPRLFEVVKPYLEEKYPQFKDWQVPDGLEGEEGVKAYLETLRMLFPEFQETYTVEKMPPTQQIDPLLEAEQIFNKRGDI